MDKINPKRDFSTSAYVDENTWRTATIDNWIHSNIPPMTIDEAIAEGYYVRVYDCTNMRPNKVLVRIQNYETSMKEWEQIIFYHNPSKPIQKIHQIQAY